MYFQPAKYIFFVRYVVLDEDVEYIVFIFIVKII